LPSLKDATQPRDTSNLVPITPPATPAPTLIDSSADPEFDARALAPIPTVLGTDTDAARQFYRSSVSQVRMPVLPTQSKIAVGAQAQSIAEEVVAAAADNFQVSLTMPSDVFDVSGSPGNNLVVTFVPQAPHTFFMGPATSVLDKIAAGSGHSTSVATGSVTTTQADDFCLCVVSDPNPNTRVLTGGLGWSVDENIFVQYSGAPSDDFYFLTQHQIPSPAGPINGTATINVSDQWAAAMACFNPLPGVTPSILQVANGSNNGTGTPTTTASCTLPNPTVAGSIIIVAYNTQGYAVVATDSQSNGYVIAVNGENANDAAANVAIAYAINTTPGTTTVTITSPQAVPLTMYVYEVSGLLGLTGSVPTFRTPVGADITSVLPVSGATSITSTLPRVLIVASASVTPYTVTLPDATKNVNQEITVKNITGSNQVTVAGFNGSQSIDGSTTYTTNLATQYGFVTVISDGSVWWVVSAGT